MEKALLIRVNGRVEDGIKTVLEASQKPISTEVLAFLLGKPTYKIDQALGRLEKWNKVRKVTCSKVGYWKLK